MNQATATKTLTTYRVEARHKGNDWVDFGRHIRRSDAKESGEQLLAISSRGDRPSYYRIIKETWALQEDNS